MGKLTAVAVKAALANPGTYQEGDGLFLKVDKRGVATVKAAERARWIAEQERPDEPDPDAPASAATISEDGDERLAS